MIYLFYFCFFSRSKKKNEVNFKIYLLTSGHHNFINSIVSRAVVAGFWVVFYFLILKLKINKNLQNDKNPYKTVVSVHL
jgi:hypothetical protein